MLHHSMPRIAKYFDQCCLRRFPTIVVALLTMVACLVLLLWKQFEVKEFIIELSKDTRFLELKKSSKISEQIDQKQEDHVQFKDVYTVIRPANPAVAWQPVTFHIQPKLGSNLLVGQTSFRGEAIHELEVIVLDITHVGGDIYMVTFTPSFGGEYRISVLLTYVNGENFNYNSHVTSRITHIERSPFRLAVESRRSPEGITRYCSQLESGIARGRWVRCGSIRGIERCGRWQMNMDHDFDKLHSFFWLPYECQLHHYTNHEMKTCFARNGWENIIFTGDSHTRYRAYHWATRLYGKCDGCGKSHVTTRFELVPRIEWVFDARGTRWPVTFPSVTRPNEIYVHPKTIRSLFSDPLPDSTKNGDLYLMNFGHWLLREVTFEKFMADKLRAYLKAVKLMNNSKAVDTTNRTVKKSRRFLWVNTMSLVWREDKYVRNWTMTPSPSIIAYTNSFIDQAMKEEGVQVVDAFQVSNARLNAAHDETHYAKIFPNAVCAGAVENAVTNVILNALCN